MPWPLAVLTAIAIIAVLICVFKIPLQNAWQRHRLNQAVKRRLLKMQNSRQGPDNELTG